MERLVMFSGLLLTNFNVYLHNFNSHEICDKKKTIVSYFAVMLI